MITYEVRGGQCDVGYATKEKAMSQGYAHASYTLWQIERESEVEAAVRRMGWIERRNEKGETLVFAPSQMTASGQTASQYIDCVFPPPAPKETQLDWNTGEPLRAEKSWQESSGVWIACVSDSSPERLFCSCIVSGKLAAGPTQQAALANLRAIRESLKSQTR